MKVKFLFALFMSCAFGLSAQGYLDGIEYYRADQYANARTILERTLDDADTDKAVSYYYLGQLAIKYRQLDKAREYFNKGIEVNPNYPYNYVGLAALDLNNNDKKAAENNIKSAKKLAKKDAQLLVDIARVYYDVDKNVYRKDIDKTLKEAYKANPEEPNYYLFIGDTVIVKASNNRELGDAASYYDQAILYAPNSAYTVVKYSSLYEKLNPEYAISRMKEFLVNNPNSALAQRELAERLFNQQMYNDAVVAYGQYIKMPGHFTEDEERYAILLFSSSKYADAFDVAKEAAQKAKNPFVMERIMYYSKSDLKEYADAYKYAQAFFEKYPEVQIHSVGDYFYYANIAENMAKLDTANISTYNNVAIDSYKNIVTLDSMNVVAYKSLASIYSNTKDYDNALSYTEQYAAKAEDLKDSDYRNWANLLVSKSEVETDPIKKKELQTKALATIEKAVEITKSPYIARAAGYMYYQILGEYTTDFEKHYLKSLELLDSDAFYAEKTPDMYKNVLRSLGVYYYNGKNNAKAKEMFTRYLQFAPEDTQISNLIKGLK